MDAQKPLRPLRATELLDCERLTDRGEGDDASGVDVGNLAGLEVERHDGGAHPLAIDLLLGRLLDQDQLLGRSTLDQDAGTT